MSKYDEEEKQKIKQIIEYLSEKMNENDLTRTRPTYVIFLDKDGTTDFSDGELNKLFDLVKMTNGVVVVTTGRTLGDIKYEYYSRGAKIPASYIIADNGAVIYEAPKKGMRDGKITKQILDRNKVKQILDKYVELGGDLSLIRVTNGEQVIAVGTREVRDYYKGNSAVKFVSKEKIVDIATSQDITKITLAGPKSLIDSVMDYSKNPSIGFWTDSGNTKFPNKHADYNNVRVDISDRSINKGNAVKRVVQELKPLYTYYCLGNDMNDLSMFYRALEDNATAIIIGNNEELLRKVKGYQTFIGRGKVEHFENGLKNPGLRRIIEKNKNIIMDAIDKTLEKRKKNPGLYAYQDFKYSSMRFLDRRRKKIPDDEKQF